jgi:hypothetical protein
MNEAYLDETQTSSEILQSTTTWSKHLTSKFQNELFPHLSNLQAAFLKVLSKEKKRVLIECQYPQGKTTCSYLSLLSLLLQEHTSDQTGKFHFMDLMNSRLIFRLHSK